MAHAPHPPSKKGEAMKNPTKAEIVAACSKYSQPHYILIRVYTKTGHNELSFAGPVSKALASGALNAVRPDLFPLDQPSKKGKP